MFEKFDYFAFNYGKNCLQDDSITGNDGNCESAFTK